MKIYAAKPYFMKNAGLYPETSQKGDTLGPRVPFLDNFQNIGLGASTYAWG